jgi:hypothetical protein
MFNEVSNGGQNRQAVDDIFAETDKAAAPAGGPAPEIAAQRVGLTSEESGVPVASEEVAGQNDKWFKIIIIVIVALIVILGGYLAYSKFMKPAPAPAANAPVVPSGNVTPAGGNVVIDIPAADIPADTGDLATTTTATTTPADGDLATTSAPVLTDTDNDGLTDAEEAAAGTNPLLADTDADTLGDYEELKIYKSNPLIPDTDGDTYSDGSEVASGYDPNGPGKLPGAPTPGQ